MRIGVDIRVLMDKYYSGVSEYTANLLSAILDIDKQNEYKLFYNSWGNQCERLKKWERDNARLYFSRYSNKIFNYLFQYLLARPKIDKFIGGSDVFWSPHFNFTKLSRETKKVITVHDLSFLRYPEFFSARKNFWHQALRVKQTLSEADLIIAISENTRNDLVELLKIPENKVRVIYSGNNGVSNFTSEAERLEYLNKHNLSERFILYLGTIEPRKNLVGLIKAYDLFRDKNPEMANYKLILAGAKGWKNKEIYKTAKKSLYREDIIFLGYVEKRTQEILYKSASLFIFPSFYEGFGFPPLEAMSAGLPVICSSVSSLPEVVSGAAILVDPFSPSDIAMAIQEVLTSDDLRTSLITKGLSRAQEFSWEKTAQEYLEVFKKLNNE